MDPFGVRLFVVLAHHPLHTGALVLLIGACSSPPSSGTSASSSTAVPASTAAAAVTASLASDECAGRGPVECVATKGCILDQPAHGETLCRPARNACENAVRQADLIGSAADPMVTEAVTASALASCNATAGCGATKASCSCPSALLRPPSKCECGGHYLRRCAPTHELARLEGVPARKD